MKDATRAPTPIRKRQRPHPIGKYFGNQNPGHGCERHGVTAYGTQGQRENAGTLRPGVIGIAGGDVGQADAETTENHQPAAAEAVDQPIATSVKIKFMVPVITILNRIR